jgi:hypothetical protein
MKPCLFLLASLLALLPAKGAAPPTTAPAPPTTAQAWAALDQAFGARGSLRGEVYTLQFVRDDLSVTVDKMPVPPAAGIESIFHFYRCTCGKLNVTGQFVVTENASADVQGVLSAAANLRIVSIGPLLLDETPRLLVIRFQGEGHAEDLVPTLKNALTESTRQRAVPEPFK